MFFIINTTYFTSLLHIRYYELQLQIHLKLQLQIEHIMGDPKLNVKLRATEIPVIG